MNNLVEIVNLTKKYGANVAVNNLTVSLPKGKIIGLLGPNGSGKTTLIKMLNGLLTPTEGTIMIDGNYVGPATKSKVAYLPDRTYLTMNQTIREILDFFQDFYTDFSRERAEEMLKSLGIDPSVKMRTLSKGTKEKVQLILVMSRNASLYILDEPIAGVDPAARDYILRTIINNYNPEATVLISTHLIEDVEQVLDEVIFMRYGQLVLYTSVDNIREEKGKSVLQGGVRMLGKLMKYEWKNIWKAGTLMLLGMFIVTVIGCVVLQMPGVAEFFDSNDVNGVQTWLMISSFVATLILYVIMLLASTWGMLIFLGIRFYRSMYTDEGYLSHTLPVTANQLFLSKILVSGVWYLFISIGIGISVVALVVSLMTGLLNIGELSSVLTQYNGNIWEFLADAFYELGRTYEEEMGINLLHYGITLLLTYVAGPFITMVTLFGALTIGQLSSKHKGLMGILAYAGLTILSSIIGSTVQSAFMFGTNVMSSSGGFSVTTNMVYDINVITSLLIAAIMYGVSYYIMNRKLNLD